MSAAAAATVGRDQSAKTATLSKRPKLPYTFMQLAGQTEPEHVAFIQRQRAPPAWMKNSEAGTVSGPSASFVYDSRYKVVNIEVIRHALHVFDHDTNIQMAWKIKLDAAFGGGLRIEYPKRGSGVQLAGMSNEQKDKFVKSMLLECAKRSNRFLWGIGFAAFTYVPDKDGFRVGRMLELDQVQTRHYRNALGEDSYAYFEQQSTMFNGGFAMGASGGDYGIGFGGAVQIPNVYTWTDMAPEGGTPCSRVLNLLASKHFIESLQGFTLVGGARNSNPPMITERFSKTYDSKDLKDTGFGRLQNPGAAGGGPNSMPSSNDMWIQQFLSTSDRLASALGTEQFDELRHKLLQMLVARTTGTAGPRIDLEDDRKYQKPAMAQGPADVVNYMRLHQEAVLMTFGIPPVMVQAESSRGRTSGQDVNALSVFKNGAKAFKQTCIQQFEDMHDILFKRALFAEYLQNLPVDTVMDRAQLVAGASAYAEVAFDLPGTPPEDVFKELYMMGFYKKDAYRQFLSTNYGIPINDLNVEPEISRELLLGKAGQMGATAGKASTASKSAASAGKDKTTKKRKAASTEKNEAAEVNKKAKKAAKSVAAGGK